MSRPQKEIDWALVDFLLKAGSPGTEIAAKFDLHPDTFYKRVLDKYNVCFTVYSQSKVGTGKADLRAIMYSRALKGNDKMCLHFAKHLLGQWDKIDTSQINPESAQQILALINQLNLLQQGKSNPELENQTDLNSCNINSNPET